MSFTAKIILLKRINIILSRIRVIYKEKKICQHSLQCFVHFESKTRLAVFLYI